MVKDMANPWQLNMHPGVTPISHDMYNLHMIAIGVCSVIGIIVFSVMFYALLKHRKSRGHVAANFHDHTRLEIFWTIIPFLILVGLAVPATKILIRMEDNSQSDLTIKIVGYQWKWLYEYLDQGIRFFSNLSTPWDQIYNKKPKNEWYLLEVDKPLIVPINRKIRFLVTANDVIHSWWVPALGIKRDAIPGFIHESWARIDTPGTYRGQCAELCGINHGYMPIVVKAIPEKEFDAWVASQTAIPDPYSAVSVKKASLPNMSYQDLMKIGEEKYNQFCSVCHKPDGTGIPPIYPALKNSSVSVGRPIERHIQIILDGVPNTAMLPFKDQLTDEEIAAITTYERNAWENNTGDIVQPNDIVVVREGNKIAPTKIKKAQPGGLQ